MMRAITFFCLATCTAILAAGQTPTINTVVNAGSSDAGLCPGVVATVTGNFAAKVVVMVGGKQAYLFYNGATQLGIQIPAEIPAAATTLTVATSNGTSQPFSLSLSSVAPALFSGLKDSNGKIITAQNPAHPGDSITVTATGLGATTPPVATGTVSSKAAATTQTASITVGGKIAQVSFSGIPASQDLSLVGTYQVVFTVPNDASPGNQDVVLTLAGKSTKAAALIVSAVPVSISSVVNGASFTAQAPIAPGSFASVFAAGLGVSDNLSLFPSTSFQNLSVTFNGIPSPLFHVISSAGQINLLVPSELPETGTANVEVRRGDTASASMPVHMSSAAPGIFRIGSNAAAQISGTAWIPMPAALASSLKVPQNCAAAGINPAVTCAQPAAPGDYIQIYATGLGKATPDGDPNGTPLPTGETAPADGSKVFKTILTPQVSVGGLPVDVLFSGLTPGYAGLYQINFRIPLTIATGDTVPVVVSMAGIADTATIAVQSAK